MPFNTSAVKPDNVPVLTHPVDAPSAFTPDALMAAVRAERKLSGEPVPPVCVLDFDGDLTDWLVANGVAQPWSSWACFHTPMYAWDVDGTACAIVPRTIGGPFAVLIAEQLRASGARIVLGLTSAGRVSGSLPVPSLVVPTQAIRDEGTSYHYLAPRRWVAADPVLSDLLATGLDVGLPVFRGSVWTTDAQYRETAEQLTRYAEEGVLAVEMQAASLFAFAAAKHLPAGIVAHVTNAVDHTEDAFAKGSHAIGRQLLDQMCRCAMRYLDI